MKTEFNLSDKIGIFDNAPFDKKILASDVQEFIRLLKERLCYCKEDMECAHCQVIDKLAGERLSGVGK
jgi:hypothetical protein